MNEVKINVLLNNNNLEAYGLAYFTIVNKGKQYLFYTLNEITVSEGKELTKVYVAETKDVEGYNFEPISQDDWLELKGIMGKISLDLDEAPTDIQFSNMTSQTYRIGEAKKIGVGKEKVEKMLSNQQKYEPSNTAYIPNASNNFFDPSLKQDEPAIETSSEGVIEQGESAIPNAFDMSIPTPVEAMPQTELVEQVEEKGEVEMITQETSTEFIETPKVDDISVVPTTEQVPTQTVEKVKSDDKEEAMQGLIKFMNFVGADMNKVNEIFSTNEVVKEEVKVEEKIDLNLADLPVVKQEPVVADNVLTEEPALQEVSLPTQGAVETPQVETPVAETVETPVEAVAEVPQTLDTSVPVIEQPIQPVELVETADPGMIVQDTTTVSAPVEEDALNVQAPIIQQDISAAEVPDNFEVPQTLEPVQVETPSTENVQAPAETQMEDPMGIPTITPLTQADLKPLEPAAETNEAVAEESPTFLDAGPVIMPVGQEGAVSQGLPGDAGAKVLERAA